MLRVQNLECTRRLAVEIPLAKSRKLGGLQALDPEISFVPSRLATEFESTGSIVSNYVVCSDPGTLPNDSILVQQKFRQTGCRPGVSIEARIHPAQILPLESIHQNANFLQ
jgi:hypothetical protein